MTLYDCESWLRNPLINPKTGRQIKLDGPTYRKIEKECLGTRSPRRRPVSFSVLECDQWFKNDRVNPRTGRQIKFNGPTYLKLKSDCKEREEPILFPGLMSSSSASSREADADISPSITADKKWKEMFAIVIAYAPITAGLIINYMPRFDSVAQKEIASHLIAEYALARKRFGKDNDYIAKSMAAKFTKTWFKNFEFDALYLSF